MTRWTDRFDRLLRAMASGEPHKAGKKAAKAESARPENPKNQNK